MSLRAVAAGVDTWAPTWRVGVETALARHLEAVCTIPSAVGGRLHPERVGGHRIAFWPASGLLKAEGHPNEHGLAPVASLPEALVAIERELAGAGIELPWLGRERRFTRHKESEGYAGLRRLDLTFDLRADKTSDGRELLAAAEAAARMSPYHAPTYHRTGKAGHTVT